MIIGINGSAGCSVISVISKSGGFTVTGGINGSEGHTA